jgi:serine/threonine protein kinase
MNVITENGFTFFLDDTMEITRGGEGRIMLVKELPNTVAKIYFNPQNAISPQKIAELQVLDNQYFIKPKELIYNIDSKGKKKQAIGFYMDFLDQQYYQLAALFSLPFCQRNHIGERDKLQIIKTIKIAIEQAHYQKIVIGDLSGLNIMVSPNKEVKFIDTDAYGTPNYPHKGVLLDEIRDYLYANQIDKNSDAFAFAVLVFQLLAYTHPFKGIHKVHKTLKDRIMHKIPVFLTDTNLLPPKCYQPLQNAQLQSQFEAIFVKGDRFLIDEKEIDVINTHAPSITRPRISHGELSMQNIYQLSKNEYFNYIKASKKLLLIKTNQRFLLFDVSNYGYVQKKCEFQGQEIEDAFVTDKNLLIKEKNNLYYLTECVTSSTKEINGQFFQLVQNFQFSPLSRWVQYQHILAVVEDNLLKYIHLDEINKSFIGIRQTPAFGQGLHLTAMNGSLWQQTGGKQYIFYQTDMGLATVPVPLAILQSQFIDNVGIIAYKSQNADQEISIKNVFCQVSGFTAKLEISTHLVHQMKTFALKKNNTQSLVFEPMDNALLIRLAKDFQPLQEVKCDLLSEETQVFDTQAGIIAFEGDFCMLLNNK